MNEVTKNTNLNKKNVSEPPRFALGVKTRKRHPKEKHMIASSILAKNLKQLFIRSITIVISIAPQAAPAMKDATRSPIHENTCP